LKSISYRLLQTSKIEQVPRAPAGSAAETMTQQIVVAVALAGCITELQTLALWPSWQSLHHHLHLKGLSYRLLQTSLIMLQVLQVHGHVAPNATTAIILPEDVVASHVVLCITQEMCAPWLAEQNCGAPFASCIIQKVHALRALVLLPCAAPSAVAAICLECGASAAYVGICILPTVNVALGGLPAFKMCMMGQL
jgi:hypothetical protein